jgi:glutathione peroxidase
MILIFAILFGGYSMALDTQTTTKSIYAIPVKDIDGKATDLSSYKGKVLVVVNTASKCGYTPQYEGLEKMYEKYKTKGVVVLGFPSNDFGGQEPGTNQEVHSFCKLKYGVTFPLFEKGAVKGPEKQPLFSTLLKMAPQSDEIKWNFEKFLIDRQGHVVSRFLSAVKPDSPELVKAIEKVL